MEIYTIVLKHPEYEEDRTSLYFTCRNAAQEEADLANADLHTKGSLTVAHVHTIFVNTRKGAKKK